MNRTVSNATENRVLKEAHVSHCDVLLGIRGMWDCDTWCLSVRVAGEVFGS